ncbi:MAG: DMT family transporter [Ignisphaera sp.]
MAAQITIVIASLIWSLHPAPIYRFRQHITPITYTAFRAASAIAFLLLLLPFNTMELGGLRHTIMAIIAVSAILGPGIDDIAYTGAAQLTGSSPAVVISYTYMFIAQTIAVALLSEQIFRSTLIGAILGGQLLLLYSCIGWRHSLTSVPLHRSWASTTPRRSSGWLQAPHILCT